MGEARACGEKTSGGGKTMVAESLVDLEAGFSFGKKEAAWEAAVMRAWK